MNRTERQLEGIKRGIKAGGHGSGCGTTGTGKSGATIMLIKQLLTHQPNLDVLIIVPTQVLKDQGINDYIIPQNLIKNCRVAVLKGAAATTTTCDLLVIDEAHLTPTASYASIFTSVDYSMILCLTATMERLDGKEILVKQYAPVCDTITFAEAEANGGVSSIKNYCVLLDVDLTNYKEADRKFNGFFAFFGFDFNAAMQCATNKVYRARGAKACGQPLNIVTANAMGFMKALRARKTFVMSHPKKLEIAKHILEAKKDKKCITFSATIKDAEAFKCGYVLHSKQSKKQNEEIIDAFNKCSTGVLHSSKACDAGVDVKGLSVGIILAGDSSKTRSTQRVVRLSINPSNSGNEPTWSIQS